MSHSNGYNGWKNYETWLANLWLTNDQGLDSLVQETAIEFFGESESKETAIESLSDWLENFFKEFLIPELQPGFVDDLLNSAVSEIDWYEISDHYISDLD